MNPPPQLVAEATDTHAPLVRVDGLHVTYVSDDHPALRDFSLSIAKGELIGLVGESGAGKTTLARALMGKLKSPGRVNKGEVTFQGNSMTDLSDATRQDLLGNRIAMIVANPRSELNPILTVGQQIVTVLRHHKGLSRPKAEAEALAMLKAVHIPDAERRMNSYAHELSGGMAQRIVIAIALCCGPDFVISDDATSGLDVTVQNQVLSLVADMVREKSASALFITRDITIAAHFCTRIVILYRGEMVETATTADFFDRPAHPYSLSLMAAFAHNADLRRAWSIDGTDETEPPATGCIFAPRCVRRQDRCDREAPALRALTPTSRVRCHFPVEG
jgi:oligopeptide/dipeptide ABC transporter ATP-binding protein